MLCTLRDFQCLFGGSTQPRGLLQAGTPCSPATQEGQESHTPRSLLPLLQALGKLPAFQGCRHADVRYTLAEVVKLLRRDHKEEARETCSSFAFKSKEMEKENERRKASVWRKKGNPWTLCTTWVPLGSQALLSEPPGVWAAHDVSAGSPCSQGSCGATCSTLPVLQLHGVAEAFAVPASQPSFSLCPLLPPSLPRSAVPKRSPQEICTQIPSSESVSRESDLSQGGSTMFSVCDEWKFLSMYQRLLSQCLYSPR